MAFETLPTSVCDPVLRLESVFEIKNQRNIQDGEEIPFQQKGTIKAIPVESMQSERTSKSQPKQQPCNKLIPLIKLSTGTQKRAVFSSISEDPMSVPFLFIRAMLVHLLLLTIFSSSSSDAIVRSPPCPDEVSLRPCTCDWEGINCNLATTPSQLTRAFSSPPREIRFRSLWMHGTPLQRLESNTFGIFSFISVSIRHNALASMGEGVFDGSSASLRELDLSHNCFPHVPFRSLEALAALEELRMHHNVITRLPDRAFGAFSRLQTLDLSHNEIELVGEFAFSALPRLERLDLTKNKLLRLSRNALHSLHPQTKLKFLGLAHNDILSVEADAFSGMATALGEVILAFNRLQTIDKEAFAPLVQRLEANDEAQILLLGNPIRCDVRLSWLLDLHQSIRRRMLGVSCNGKSLGSIDIHDLLPYSD